MTTVSIVGVAGTGTGADVEVSPDRAVDGNPDAGDPDVDADADADEGGLDDAGVLVAADAP